MYTYIGYRIRKRYRQKLECAYGSWQQPLQLQNPNTAPGTRNLLLTVNGPLAVPNAIAKSDCRLNLLWRSF